MSQNGAIDLEGALNRYGLKSFRPGQLDVISQILAGHDCLCVMPTGGGKSLCFQLPSLVRPGLTIVISPLIALMKDQVDSLQKRGISATLVNSSLSGTEQNQRLQWISEGKYSLVYVAPERLRNPRFLEAIRATPIQLLAIDEAHCISEWGHDFRPDYARIGDFREWLGGVQTIALTATATPRVRRDIVQLLKLRSPKQFITGFARKNLHFSVIPCRSDLDKEEQIIQFLRTQPGSGIIYAATRKRCEELAETLSSSLKVSLGAYHAGLTIDQRKFIQEQFMKGDLQAIVATNAFGMGIDKADLRYVIHYNIPGSLEAYYQESGRAGRDGKPSQCVLLYSYQDRYIQEFFIDNGYPPKSMVEEIYDYLLSIPEDPIELTQQEIRENLDLSLSAEAVGTSLQLIARTGVLERLEAGAGLAMVRISSDLPTLVDLLPKTSERRRKVLRILERTIGDRRYEAVYVHPRWLMDQAQLERDALQETLRELCKLEAFEYIPPFRGRAIHFRRREVPFADLKIDFQTLEEMKRAEYEKLDQVIAFAESKRCRQLSVLQYFGDPSAAPCGLCDRCLNRTGWFSLKSGKDDGNAGDSIGRAAQATSHSEELVVLLRKVLQAVARTQGRLGRILIAQFLTGSSNAKIQRLRLHQIAGFGCLNALTQADACEVIDRLLATGLLEQHEVDRNRPTVSISESGMLVLNGSQSFPQGMNFPSLLLSRLGAIGKESVPDPRLPTSPAIRRVDEVPSGVASGVATGATASVVPTIETRPSATVPSFDGAIEDWHWTWRLAMDGYALFECAAVRRKTMDGILKDLETAVRAGRSLPLEKLFDQEMIAVVQRFMMEDEFRTEEASPHFRRHPALIPLLKAILEKSVRSQGTPASTRPTNPVF